MLSNGNIAVFWDEWSSEHNYYDYSLKVQVLDQNGNAVNASPIDLGQNVWTQHVLMLSNGNVAVFLNGYGGLLEAQVLDQNGNIINSAPITLGQNGDVQNVSLLSNGNMAVFWSDYDSNYGSHFLKAQIFDPDGNAVNAAPVILGDNGCGSLQNVSLLSNGNIAVFWSGYEGLEAQVLDQNGNAVNAAPINLGQNAGIQNVSILSNGNIAVFWNEYDSNWNASLEAQIFDPNGNAINAAPITLGQNVIYGIQNVSVLSNGDIALFWSNPSLQTQVLDSQGNFVSTDALKLDGQNASAIDNGILANPYTAQAADDILSNQYYNASQAGLPPGSENLAGIFMALLSENDPIQQGMPYPNMAANNYALAAPIGIANLNVKDMDAVLRLSSIINNPTEEQALIIATVQSLIQDMNDMAMTEEDKELQAEVNKIVEITANYLLNQALPGLIKAGDVAGVKNGFRDLGEAKTRLMLEYQTATTPYYEELKKMLRENAEGLQAKGILGKTVTQEELDKLPPKELNKILDMIRKDPSRTFEEDYILQQEAKYHKKYIEPNKKILEEKMKAVLKDFTKKLLVALDVKKK